MTITYLDSGVGGPEECLGRWLDGELLDGIRAFRGQFGFFDLSALRKFLPVLQAMVDNGGIFRLVIGANNGDPASIADVNALLPLVTGDGNARLAIVGLSNALFHPKTLHLVRANDTPVGVVGSANLTSKGLGHNVEAGIVIESSDANRHALDRIGAAIDYWFDCADAGVYEIASDADAARLVEMGLIVPASTRRRLRSANRARGTVVGRGTRTAGWRPPQTPGVDEPPEVEGGEPQEFAGGLPAERAAIAARWCKLLRSSDAQQVRQGTNPTGKLRLAKARFGIDQTTYFREEFFGTEEWIEVDRRGTMYEEAHVRFTIARPGHEATNVTLRVDHAPHRVADQNNVPTVLGWGHEIGQWLRNNDQAGRWAVLEKDLDGHYWLSFQADKPEWAP